MVFLFSDIFIYARPNLLEKRESCDRWSLHKLCCIQLYIILLCYIQKLIITLTEHMNFAVCCRYLIQLFAFYTVTIGYLRLKYFCRLEPNFNYHMQNFHQDKIFTTFTTCSHWWKLHHANFLSCVKKLHKLFLQYKGSRAWRDFYPAKIFI